MNDELEINEVAKQLINLLHLFSRKLLRPLEHMTKNLASPLQIHTMIVLNEKKLLTMTELSNEMTISKQQMTPIIDKLIDSGFVHRKHDDIDRRSVNISLTSLGINFLEDIGKEMTSIIQQRIEGLDKADLLSLNQALIDSSRIINKIQLLENK